MVMRTMRENTKWIMLILTLAFVGWLVFDWVQGRTGAAGATQNPVVALVGGQEIRYVEWNRHLQDRLDQARRSAGGALSDERRHRVREAAWEELINQTLIRQELSRLGLEATDEEIRRAFRSSPPPQLRDHPAFQTDGEFDLQKYREFFSGPAVDRQLLLQIEQYYREVIPRSKLFSLIAEEIVVTDQELWEYYRRRNETARVRFVSVDPSEEVPDSLVEVTEAEIRRFYQDHPDRFSRPPTAVVDLASLEARPGPGDTARARRRVDSLRALIVSGDRSFEEIASEESADPATGEEGGDLGTVARGDLRPALDSAAFSLTVGTVSRPLLSPAGYHLVEVTSREDDRASLRHILVPIELSPEAEDELFEQMDRLEGIALREGLEVAADSLGIPLRAELRLAEGSEFVPGAGALGVAVAWAFDPETAIGDLSQFFENPTGHHLLELERRIPRGTRPLDEVRDAIRQELAAREKRNLTRERLSEAGALLAEGRTLREIADRRGWEIRESGSFNPVDFVPGLGRETAAVGASFGLPVGTAGGPYDAGDRVALLRVLERSEADREQFRALKERLRRELESRRRGEYVDRWLAALRDQAEVRDLRDQLATARTAARS